MNGVVSLILILALVSLVVVEARPRRRWNGRRHLVDSTENKTSSENGTVLDDGERYYYGDDDDDDCGHRRRFRRSFRRTLSDLKENETSSGNGTVLDDPLKYYGGKGGDDDDDDDDDDDGDDCPPTPRPTKEPTSLPTFPPTPDPTPRPTPRPTELPTPPPTPLPTPQPTPLPTPDPTPPPTPNPTPDPTPRPTPHPTLYPTKAPFLAPCGIVDPLQISQIVWNQLTGLEEDVFGSILGVADAMAFNELIDDAVLLIESPNGTAEFPIEEFPNGGDVVYDKGVALGEAAPAANPTIAEDEWPSLLCYFYFAFWSGMGTTCEGVASPRLVEKLIVEYTDGIIFGINKVIEVPIPVSTGDFTQASQCATITA